MSAGDIIELDVDGMIDRRGVKFIGTARRQPDGTYRCLADVGGALLHWKDDVTIKLFPVEER